MKRVAFSSDFHIDLNKIDVIESVKGYLKANRVDVFCFAGDMSHTIDVSVKALREIEDDLGIKVLAVAGNHEMWDTENGDSFDALHRFNLGLPNTSVMVSPYEFSDWVVLGNLGWYDYSTAMPFLRNQQLDKMRIGGSEWQDRRYCDWNGKKNGEVADFLLKELRQQLETYKNKKIILMSHIVPYSECIVVKNDKNWDYFNSYIGNLSVGRLADEYGVKIAHFGHTHFRYHKYSQYGVEMICAPLGYYGEWVSPEGSIQEELKKCIPIIEM